MDRLALALVASGLAVILATVVSVMGVAQSGLVELAAPGAALGGISIVGGLAMLERRAFGAARHAANSAVSA